jgi:hypothetical protein
VQRSAWPSAQCAARYVICPVALLTRLTECRSSRIVRLDYDCFPTFESFPPGKIRYRWPRQIM